jgi:flagellar biosynthesis/type III secretory pathway chaperone
LKATVDQLKALLSQELDIYHKLYQLAEQKKKLLLEKFSTELQGIVTQEEILVQRLIDIEPERISCVAKIAGREDANLDEAVEAVAEADGKSDLWMTGSKLKDAVAAIKKINDENQRLLEQALELTQYSIKLITRAPKDVTYGASGVQGSKKGHSLIDRKA